MSQRILVIQADVVQANVIRRSLLSAFDATLQVEWVRNCAEGVLRLENVSRQAADPITAIIADLFLSDSQGVDTVERLLRVAPHVPILLLCSPQHEAIARLAIQRGAHDYLLRDNLNSEVLMKSLLSMIGRAANIGALFEENERAQAVLNSIGDAIISVDPEGEVTYLNAVAESLTGWPHTEAVGQTSEKVLRIVDATTRESVPNPLTAAMIANETLVLPPNSICIRRDGVEIAIEDSTAPIHDHHGQLTGAVMVFHDVSAARAQAMRLSHLAWHDSLTDLPNSTLFNDRLTQAMALAHRHGHKLAVIFVDVDRFKIVNDSLGHLIGDRLLQSVAHRLQSCVRSTDTVSRRGGDEFVILLSEVAHAEDAGICAEKILADFSAPHFIDQHAVQVTASLGIATYPDDGTEAETLLRNADFAMYYAKDSGRHRYQFFKPALNLRTNGQQTVDDDLRQALARNEFILHYQPKINLMTGDIFGVEALVRWHHPQRGLMLPGEFIAAAEASGHIVPLGRWVLREACRQARRWRDAGLPALCVAINVSPLELRSDNFIADVYAALLETGLEPGDVEFELTDSVLMHDSDQVIAVLQVLKQAGVQLALDDFGAGRWSLCDLKRLPVNTLNLDPAIVRQLGTGTESASIFDNAIGALMGMSIDVNMKMRVVAKGVETHQELLFLQSHRCAGGQGHYFSQPLEVPEITKLLEEIVQTQCLLA